MKIQRTIPPSAAPLHLKNLLYGVAGIFFGQKYINRLEGELREYFGAKHVFLVSSGKAALTLILKALNSLDPRREALIPAYTCFSVPSAIVKAGLRVSLCDIDPEAFDFDYKLLEQTINNETLCVIPCNLFGIPSDIDRIKNLCRERGVFVVEDAAQAMGGTYKGKMLGTIGDVGFFSLGRGKNITCGSGGIVMTNSDQIAGAITKHYSNFEDPSIKADLKEFFQLAFMAIFIRPSMYWFPSGLPFLKLGETIFHNDFPIRRLSGMQAGLLNGWQRLIDELNNMRRKNAMYFCERLKISKMPSIPYIRLPIMVSDGETKERIYSISKKKGLGISQMYPTPINEIDEIRSQFDNHTFSYAKAAAEVLLTIPTHQFLKEKDKEEIIELFSNQLVV